MVSLIVVDYKTMKKTLQYICECCEAITDSQCMHIIIVDNSDDVTIGLQSVREESKSEPQKMQSCIHEADLYQAVLNEKPILYVHAKQNLGYAKGNNLGASVAKDYYQDDYYLFSNNDLRFPKEFALQELLVPMKRDYRIAAVGPRIVDTNGIQQSPRKKNSVWKQLFCNYYDMLLPKKMKFTDRITDVLYTEESTKCYWVTGAFFIADAAKFERAGGFDVGTFLYCEEMILAERLQKYKYEMYYESAVSILHEHGQTVKSAYNALKGIHISFQSSMYYFKQYRKTNAVVLFLAQVNYAIFSILFYLKKRMKKLFHSR